MQIYTIVIGGLEKSYMQKLVLYLNERLGKSARVELLEHWEIPEQPEVWEMKKQSVGVPMEGSKCWDTGIGSEAFITYLTEQASGKSYLDGDSTEMCGEGYGEGCCVSISA